MCIRDRDNTIIGNDVHINPEPVEVKSDDENENDALEEYDEDAMRELAEKSTKEAIEKNGLWAGPVTGGSTSSSSPQELWGKLPNQPLKVPFNVNNKTEWTVDDIIKWQLDPNYIWKEKQNFLKDYKQNFYQSAKKYNIPVLLLGGVAYNEFGGDPQTIDTLAYVGRLYIPFTKPSDQTSFGDLSIQMRRVRALHPTWSDYDIMQKLRNPPEGIDLAAEHLRQIVNVVFPQLNASDMSDEHITIAGARYNRGIELPLDKIKQNTSYGDRIIQHKKEIMGALK